MAVTSLATAQPAQRRAFAQRDPFLAEVLELTPKLRAYATGLTGCPERADDIVHDSLIRVLRFRDGFQPGTNLRAWLYSIVRNTYFTSIKRRGWMVSDADGLFSARLESQPTQEWSLRHKELLDALQTLEADTRGLLLLVAGGSSYEEAAEVYGCPVGTIKSRINRARRRLLRALEHEPRG